MTRTVHLLMTRPNEFSLMATVVFDPARIAAVAAVLAESRLMYGLDSNAAVSVAAVPGAAPAGEIGPELADEIAESATLQAEPDDDPTEGVRVLGLKIFNDGDIVAVAYDKHGVDTYESESFNALTPRYTVTSDDFCVSGFERLRNHDEFILVAYPAYDDTAGEVEAELIADIEACSRDDGFDYDAARSAVRDHIGATCAAPQALFRSVHPYAMEAPDEDADEGDEALAYRLYIRDNRPPR